MCCRPETKLWSPQVIEEGKAHPFKINLEAEKQVSVTEEIVIFKKKRKAVIFFLLMILRVRNK